MRLLSTAALSLVIAAAISCGGGSSMTQDSAIAQVRVMQGSPDLGNVDVFVDGHALTSNLTWHNVFPLPTTTYSSVQAGGSHFKEFATGTNSALVDTQLSLPANNYFTVLTVGEQGTGSLATLTLTDDHTAPSVGLKVRLVHGASTISTVDVYTTANATDPVPATPTLAAFTYKSASAYMQFAGSGVDICVNPTGIVPASMTRCLSSVQYLPTTQPQTSTTMVLLDPYLDPNAPPGSFASPVVFASLPY